MKIKNRKWLGYLMVVMITSAFFVGLLVLNGNKGYSLATTDALEQTVPMYYHLWDVLHLQKSFFFDWYSALGTNMAGVTAHYGFVSPINLLLLLVKREQIDVFFNVLVYIRLVLASLSMYWVLNKKNDNRLNIILAPLYSLNAYMIMYCIFPMWMDVAIVFPLLLYSLEQMMKNDTNKVCYIVFLAFSFMMDVNLVPMIIIFVVLYTGFSLFAMDKDKRGKAAVNVIVTSIIGSMISLVILLPGAMQVMVSPRIGTNFIDLIKAGYSVISYMDYQKWVMGTLSVIALIAGIPHTSNYKSNEYVIYMIMLAIMSFAMISEGSNLVWHLGTYAYWSMRFAFMMNCLSLLIISKVISLKEIGDIKGMIISFIITGICFVGAFVSFRHVQWNASSVLVKVLLVEMAVVCVLLVLQRYRKNVFNVLIVIVSVLFSIYISNYSMNTSSFDNQVYAQVNELMDTVQDDNVLHRIKNYDLIQNNYPLIIKRSGMSNYLHVVHRKQVNFDRNMGYEQNWTRMSDEGGTLVSDTLLGYTTLISDEILPVSIGCNERKTVNYYVYDTIVQSNAWLIDENCVDVQYLNTALETQQSINKNVFNSDSMNIQVLEGYVPGTDTHTVSINNKSLIYINVWSDHGLTITIGDKEICSNFNGSQILPAGEYDNDIELKVDNNGEYYLVDVGVLDVEQYYKDLKDKLIDVVVEQSGSKMTLTVNSDKDQYMLVSLFNDDGFTYVVNGNRVNDLRFLDTLMMIPVSKGENVVELSYCQPGLKAGALISLIGVVFMALYLKYGSYMVDNNITGIVAVICTYAATFVLVVALIVLPLLYMFIG